MEPATVLAIAQAGTQVLSMLSSAHDGQGRVFRAQTEMLRELVTQVSIINRKLDELVELLERTNARLGQLPGETARKAVQLILSGILATAGEVLRTRARNVREGGLAYGQEFARERVLEEAGRLLSELTIARNALLADGSLALAPIVCAAWPLELSLRVLCVELDEVRIQESADAYADAMRGWIRDHITPQLRDDWVSVRKHREAIIASRGSEGRRCYVWAETSPPEVHRGHQGDFEWRTTTLRAQLGTFSSEPVSGAMLDACRTELKTLEGLGVAPEVPVDDLVPRRWTLTIEDQQWVSTRGDRNSGPELEPIRERIRASVCGPPGTAQRFIDEENARLGLLESSLMSAVAYSHLLVMTRTTLELAEGVASRSRDRRFVERWSPAATASAR